MPLQFIVICCKLNICIPPKKKVICGNLTANIREIRPLEKDEFIRVTPLVNEISALMC
jgi:hypothetical protein